jgi:O-antigen/teichoic acid export membrane protein
VNQSENNRVAATQTLRTFSTDHLQADLKSRSVRGGLLTITSQGAQFILQSVATIVLAHMLTPADFGLVAMVTAITGLGQAFADLGLSEATIQHPEINHDQVSKLFWVNVGIGLTLTAIAACLAPFLAWFYHEPRLKAITLVVSLTFVIGGLRVQHDALLRRNMRFLALAARDVISYAVAVPAAIFLAWRGAGYWAIVALPLLLNFTGMTFSWVFAGWMPGLPKRSAGIRSLVVFGGNVAASYLTFNFTRSADSILIGWHWGAGPLGLYSRAMNLLLLPVRQLGTPARSVAVPAFSRLQDDPERLARFYLRTANVIMWITAPIFGFLYVVASPVIILALGKQWHAAGPVFQILAIFALGQLLYESLIWLFISRGQSRRLLQLALIMCPITVCGYAIGLPFGIKGVALSGTLVMLVTFPWVLSYGFRGTSLTIARLGERILCPVIACMAGVVTGEIAFHLAGHMSAIWQIVIVAVAFFTGCLFTAALRPVRNEMKELTNLLRTSRSMSSQQLAENLG